MVKDQNFNTKGDDINFNSIMNNKLNQISPMGMDSGFIESESCEEQ